MIHHPLFPKTESRQNKDVRSRVGKYLDWLEATNQLWYLPDLNAYRDFLMDDSQLSPATVAAYVGSVKEAYRHILEQSLTRLLREVVDEDMSDLAIETARESIIQATAYETARVHYERPSNIQHLTQFQVERLIGQVELETRMDLRDQLVMGLILFTGISEVELASLQVKDIAIVGEQAEIDVPEVSGGGERHLQVRDTLFYDASWWSTNYKHWLSLTGIQEGAAFRGFYRGGNSIRKTAMSAFGIQAILSRYSVPIAPSRAEQTNFTILNLRRTYARRFYLTQIEARNSKDDVLKSLSDNLSGRTTQTTQQYIGVLTPEDFEDAKSRANANTLLQKAKNLS